ncbi:MAG: HlyD family efflux transporter periplasmic adaptor subunit [Deltaproteobacteria bacterium]|nr:HlyD family efflux transporter periplasmic adaptor subunit [Deltaproteobacteria bacterium]
MRLNSKLFFTIGLLIVAGAIAFLFWQYLQPKGLGDNFSSGNGRIEAVEIDIAAKTAGRIKAILVMEGDFVTAGQVVATMDTEVLEAQRREAEAHLRKAQSGVETVHSQVEQRQSEKAAALALMAQRQAESDALQKRLLRSKSLARSGIISIQELDDAQAQALSAQAAVQAAQAQIAAAEAAITTAKSQETEALSDIEASQATIERIQADIDDSALKATRDGRVQYRIAQPGEVVAGGGKILNLLDLSDVYMTFFLPTAAAGRVAIGSEVHLVLDAAPEYVIPATVSFVADVAQFTPKTVETASERQKLMFRVKAQIAPELLKKHIHTVKTGLPGMAYVRLDPQVEWPTDLRVRLPQ